MITVGKEGGEVEVLAYVHELNPADSVSRAHKLKNEYFYFGPNLEGKKIEELFPFVSLKSREQVDDYTVRYTFSFLANDTDKSRHFGCCIYDLTYYKDYGDNRGYTMAGNAESKARAQKPAESFGTYLLSTRSILGDSLLLLSYF